MPRRISDYADAFAGWNFLSSFGSIVSVIATWLFLQVLYVQLTEGYTTTRYIWLTPQFYGDLLQTLLNRASPSIEWAINSPPKPHAFVSLPLQSTLEIEAIILELGNLLPQITDFIQQFNSTIINTGINVITDATGNLNIDVPSSMSDLEVKNITNRIGVLDRLINTQTDKASALLDKGLNLEKSLPSRYEYLTKLQDKSKILQELRNSYKH